MLRRLLVFAFAESNLNTIFSARYPCRREPGKAQTPLPVAFILRMDKEEPACMSSLAVTDGAKVLCRLRVDLDTRVYFRPLTSCEAEGL